MAEEKKRIVRKKEEKRVEEAEVKAEERVEEKRVGMDAAAGEEEAKAKVVIPGEEIVSSINYLAGYGTYREEEKIFSKVFGLLKQRGYVVSVVPLEGTYMPKVGDMVIGEITYVSLSTWKVDIGASYEAILSIAGVMEYIERSADLSKYYKRGDLIFAKVESMTEDKIIHLTMKDRKSRKLYGGKVVTIVPSKVPRLIGKEGTMINTIKDKTGCIINVGQNGRIWFKGDHEDWATEAIIMVEKNTHKEGLTEKISEFLDNKLKEVKK